MKFVARIAIALCILMGVVFGVSCSVGDFENVVEVTFLYYSNDADGAVKTNTFMMKMDKIKYLNCHMIQSLMFPKKKEG